MCLHSLLRVRSFAAKISLYGAAGPQVLRSNSSDNPPSNDLSFEFQVVCTNLISGGYQYDFLCLLQVLIDTQGAENEHKFHS